MCMVLPYYNLGGIWQSTANISNCNAETPSVCWDGFHKELGQSYLELGPVTRPNLGLSMRLVYLLGLVLS